MRFDNLVASFVVFLIFTGLGIFIYDSFQDTYEFTRQQGDENPLNLLNTMVTAKGLTQIKDVIESIKNFDTPLDALRTSFEVLTGATIGIVKILLGLIVLPFDIIRVLTLYFNLPPLVANLLGILVQIYISFMLFFVISGKK